MNDSLITESFEARSQKVLQVAKQLYQSNPDWVTFFREVLGVDGAARSVFADQNDYVAFEKTPQYSEVQQMVTNLRNRKIPGGGHNEATRVITVRLPESLHEALKVEASDHKTSMNKLCISKLLQALLDEEAMAAVKRSSAPAPRPAVTASVPVAPAPAITAPAMNSSMSTPRPHTPTQSPATPARFGNNEY